METKRKGVPGCIKMELNEKIANKIYDEMIDFAQYAFNKSHAAAYAYVTYQTAFLKYYYPVEYMAALMTSVIDKPTKVAEYIQVCRQMNIPILPPDINKGEYGFPYQRLDPLCAFRNQERRASGHPRLLLQREKNMASTFP